MTSEILRKEIEQAQLLSNLDTDIQQVKVLIKPHMKMFYQLLIITVSIGLMTLFCCLKYFSSGYFLAESVICIFTLLYAIFQTIIAPICVKKSLQKELKPKKPKCQTQLWVTLIFSAIVLVEVLVSIIYWSAKSLSYGPLPYIHENGTMLHWATYNKKKSSIQLASGKVSTPKSYYHSVFVNSTQFEYKLKSSTYEYSLPAVVKRFVVLSDIHGNYRYTSKMQTDYEYAVLCGDYYYLQGYLRELANSFHNFPTLPLLLARGNHDQKHVQYNQMNTRPRQYFQRVSNVFYFFIYVQSGFENEAFSFLNENVNEALSSEHVFIVVHRPVYSTGGYGSDPNFSKRLEEFIDTNQQIKFRAVFSGHDHVFASFKRQNMFYFVNGVGGGWIDRMTSKSGDRKWEGKERHGALTETCESCYGYQYHIDSWMKFTRTEVDITAEKIVYTVRDLKSHKILTIYDQLLQ
ncbi:Alkaline_phosphatase [Hexamita inflata]|uniref:Alkaline phosphatase n=1 Tax=Hexamita inflata TaxID=28002 RepID=A0AA86P937_9EUKA|nr:Alkaline phosphatase [Hexamita inflata]